VRRGETVHIEALAIGCALSMEMRPIPGSKADLREARLFLPVGAVGSVGGGGVGRLWQAARSAAPAKATVAPRQLSILSSQSPNAISYATLGALRRRERLHRVRRANGSTGCRARLYLLGFGMVRVDKLAHALGEVARCAFAR
jgi:hypothetical protein